MQVANDGCDRSGGVCCRRNGLVSSSLMLGHLCASTNTVFTEREFTFTLQVLCSCECISLCCQSESVRCCCLVGLLTRRNRVPNRFRGIRTRHRTLAGNRDRTKNMGICGYKSFTSGLDTTPSKGKKEKSGRDYPIIAFADIKCSASLSLGTMEHPKSPGELFFFFVLVR